MDLRNMVKKRTGQRIQSTISITDITEADSTTLSHESPITPTNHDTNNIITTPTREGEPPTGAELGTREQVSLSQPMEVEESIPEPPPGPNPDGPPQNLIPSIEVSNHTPHPRSTQTETLHPMMEDIENQAPTVNRPIWAQVTQRRRRGRKSITQNIQGRDTMRQATLFRASRRWNPLTLVNSQPNIPPSNTHADSIPSTTQDTRSSLISFTQNGNTNSQQPTQNPAIQQDLHNLDTPQQQPQQIQQPISSESIMARNGTNCTLESLTRDLSNNDYPSHRAQSIPESTRTIWTNDIRNENAARNTTPIISDRQTQESPSLGHTPNPAGPRLGLGLGLGLGNVRVTCNLDSCNLATCNSADLHGWKSPRDMPTAT